jgi:two-component system nitrogen regulation sensor histidine kinase NtrY
VTSAASDSQKSAAERKRIFEIGAMVFVTLLLVALSRLETRLFDLSETLAKNQDFLTVVYFGLINFNVVLILVLSFLLFRNVAKLVVERRRGVFGSNLRAKLVATLVFFALAPTVLMFYVSSRFIITSFDEWFSDKVRATMYQTQEAGTKVYRQDQRRLESLARIALQRIKLIAPDDPLATTPELQQMVLPGQLEGFETQYGLDTIKVYDRDGRLLWSSRSQDIERVGQQDGDTFVIEALGRFTQEPGLWSMSTVAGEDQQDVVKGVAPVIHPAAKQLIGLVMTETRFETQILKSIEGIQQSFANLRPGAQLIKLSYLILLAVMTLLIIFSAVWLGFYVARGITGPIQSLAEGTREVALGNYNVSLTAKTDDETGQLVRSFNMMTKDLQSHRAEAEDARVALLHSNEELDQRRKYMEVVLKNISAGVIAADPDGRITSVNSAAEGLLKIEAAKVMDRRLADGLGRELYDSLWKPVAEKLEGRDIFSAQLDVVVSGRSLTMLVDGTRIVDEDGEDLGLVLVFDDATEQVKVQRVAAWREVARRIAHEIKNPVTPIKLSAQRLLRRFHEKFEGEEREVFESCLDTILKQVDSLRDLVNEFSKFSKLPEIKPRMASINDVITDVCALYANSYPNVTLDTRGLGDIPDLPLDTDQMNRVFVNLVANAIEALDAQSNGGRIEFRSMVLRNLNTVRVEVIDNGCGIPANLRDRVLEPYYSTKDGGTGLGLAIVNQIISDHGGYLRVAGNEPRGTKMVIELPMGARV